MGPNQWEANSQFWVFNDGLRGGRSTLFWRHLVRGQSGPDHRVQKSPGPWRVIRWQKASRGHLAPSPPSQDPPGHLVSHLSSQPSSKCSTSSNCCLYGRAQAQVTFRLVKVNQKTTFSRDSPFQLPAIGINLSAKVYIAIFCVSHYIRWSRDIDDQWSFDMHVVLVECIHHIYGKQKNQLIIFGQLIPF